MGDIYGEGKLCCIDTFMHTTDIDLKKAHANGQNKNYFYYEGDFKKGCYEGRGKLKF